MQECLEKLETWQINSNMEFNFKKFNVLKLGKGEEIKKVYIYIVPGWPFVTMDISIVRDLGVIVNSDFN